MSDPIRDELLEYALGMLDVDRAATVGAHVATCASCAAELAAHRAALTTAGGAPIAPAPSFLRARVLASATAKGRLARYADALAELFEITAERARALLDTVDDAASWEPDPSGIALIHVAAGPRLAAMGADTGLVRFPAGMQWPLHRHIGQERHLILEGGLRIDQTGEEVHAGDTLISGAGSEHSFLVLPGEDCVTAVVLDAGIELPPGTPMRFDREPR